MALLNNLQNRDLAHIWHPCSQMKDYERFKPLPVQQAKDCYLKLIDGTQIIDAISSWWCKPLGHQHPRLKAALIEQANQFEHILLANTTNETIVKLSEKLTSICHPLSKVMYASDGSCAVEMALKMSLHARQIKGEVTKTKFAALKNGYHGETALTLSVSDLGLYKTPYQPVLQDTTILQPLPYVSHRNDPIWHNSETTFQVIEKTLSSQHHTLTAIIVEPILQGAGGMRIYSQDFLKRLYTWCQQNNVHLIADEIMTGLGRTGLTLACEHANITPDFLCLSKNLSGGWLPLSAMLTHDYIYELFYDDYETQKAFMHSHTHSGNVLAARVALEFLNILEEENYNLKNQILEKKLYQYMSDIAYYTKALHNVRAIGSVVAADLINPHKIPRLGYQIYQAAIQQGALLRPLGNTLYWLLPFTIQDDTLNDLKNITQQAILSVVN